MGEKEIKRDQQIRKRRSDVQLETGDMSSAPVWLLKVNDDDDDDEVNDFIIFPLYKEHIQHSVIRALTSWAIDDDDDDVDDDDDDDDDNDDDELLPGRCSLHATGLLVMALSKYRQLLAMWTSQKTRTT